MRACACARALLSRAPLRALQPLLLSAFVCSGRPIQQENETKRSRANRKQATAIKQLQAGCGVRISLLLALKMVLFNSLVAAAKGLERSRIWEG
jgi:hypothetical protein